MTAVDTVSMQRVRMLGAAFLIQALASMISGLFLRDPLIVQGDIVGTMTRLSANELQMQASIVLEAITPMGIAMLGVLLYVTLREQNPNVAIVGMGLYLIEAAILATSQIPAHSLLEVSRASATAGHPEYLQTMAKVYLDSRSFAYNLHMLPFAAGATLFYPLIYRSRLLPRWLSILGLIAAPVALVGALMVLLGLRVPVIVFLPSLPFELLTGLLLLIRRART